MPTPLIGITASYKLPNLYKQTRYYADWIWHVGGIPVILPYQCNTNKVAALLERLDGLLLSGGGDIDPTYFNAEPRPKLGPIVPERDSSEIAYTRYMLEQDKPILAICRGSQILNVAAGGDMYQDLASELPEAEKLIQHDQNAPTYHASHLVSIKEDTQLFEILQTTACKTNSFHHQANRKLAPNFIVSATTSDGVIEAIESKQHHYAIGVQWHPECMPFENQMSYALFRSFVSACIRTEEE